MTAASALVADVQREILSGVREVTNKLNGSVSAGATALTFAYQIVTGGSAVTAGSVLSIDLERFYVWSVNTSSQTATVEPGWDGTTQAAHADGAIVTANSRADKFAALDAINKDLDSLSSPANGLFRMVGVEISYNPSSAGYDLTGVTSLDSVYSVEARYTTLTHDWKPVNRWQVDAAQNLTDFPSGFALRVYDGGQPGQNLRVLYRAPFAHLAALTDDINTVSGLPATANDIPVLGAIERLWTPREIRRNFVESQPEPRRAEEVPPGAVAGSLTRVASLRQRRIAEEKTRLSRLYPMRARAL